MNLLFAGLNKRGDKEEPLQLEATDRLQIPDIYDSIQVLIAPDGRALAITWNSEELQIRTTHGNHAGANVSKLPDEFCQ